LFLLVFMLSVSSFSSFFVFNYNSDASLETSATNYLFNGKPYPFELNDFYDDEDLDHVWTGAKFQTEAFNDTELAWSGTINNDTVTPVNNTETQYGASSGHYPATYSFEDDVNGVYTINSDAEDNIEFVDQARELSATETVSILAGFEGHKKVLRMSNIGGDEYDPLIWNYFDAQTSGIVEFWIYIPSTNLAYFKFCLGFNDIALGFYQNSRIYTEGGATWFPYSLDMWNHIKIEFDCNGGVGSFYDLYLNNELIGDDLSFDVDKVSLSQTYMWCRGNQSIAYIDAVGYSYDPEYTPSEHHPGTYSFTNDADGENPAGWTIVETGGTVNVIAEKDNHYKVLEFYDNDPNNYVTAYNYFGGVKTDSTIEFWWAYNATETLHHYLFMHFREGGIAIVTLCLNYYGGQLGGIQVYYAGAYHTVIGAYPINTMRHVKLVFDDTANEVGIIVNDVNCGSFPYRTNPTVGIDNVYTYTRTTNAGGPYTHWIDAIYYSWDPYHAIGDNLIPSTGNVYPNNIDVAKGSYDYTDNMKSNDAIYTTFTSTHTDGYVYETPSQWSDFTFTNGTGDTIGELETIDSNWSVINSTKGVFVPDEYISSITYTKGSDGGGNLENTQTDDENYQRVNPKETYYGQPAYDYLYETEVLFIIDPAYGGRDFYFSCDITTSGSMSMSLRINGVEKASGTTIDFDDMLITGVTSIQLFGSRWTNTFYSLVKYFKLVEDKTPTSAELDVQIDMQIDDLDLSSIEFFKYSHRTNRSIAMDLDVWNWGTTTWFEIESVDNSASFDDDSFALGSASPYVSATKQVRVRFQALSSAGDFSLLIDRFRLDYLTTPAELETTITFSFARCNEDLLAMNVQSWQRTNVSQTVNFSIWNYDAESYVQISSSSETSFTKKEYNTESPGNFISSTGTVKLRWNGSDLFDDFELHIDYLLVQIYYKLDLVHTKSFDTNGIYRYRWCVLGSIHYTQWVVFEVIDPVPNFYAISESDLTTRWILQGADISAVEDFHDDVNTDYWNLVDVSEDYFEDFITGSSYLLDNVSVSSPVDEVQYTGVYFDV